jgi:hypothetical protein
VRKFIAAALISLAGCTAQSTQGPQSASSQYVDPQSVVSVLLRRHMEDFRRQDEFGYKGDLIEAISYG